jgi:hypothetical protein
VLGKQTEEGDATITRAVVDDDDLLHHPQPRLLGEGAQHELEVVRRRRIDTDEGVPHDVVGRLDRPESEQATRGVDPGSVGGCLGVPPARRDPLP